MKEKFEYNDLLQILEQIGKFRNELSEEHQKFVKENMQKEYDIVTKTFVLQGRTFTGTYKEDPKRKEAKDAYERESKLATVLASFGFDVILIEENNSLPGRKPDAIVNGIVMDFKEIQAFNESEVGKNTIGNSYQDGIHKNYTEGVVIFLHNFSDDFIYNAMEGKTSTRHNGMALFFHEDTGSLQLIDMKKIRTVHEEQSQLAWCPERLPNTPFRAETNTSIVPNTSEFNIPHNDKKSSDGNKKIRTAHEEQSRLASPPERLPKDIKHEETSTSFVSNMSTVNIPQINKKTSIDNNLRNDISKVEELSALVFDHAEVEVNGITRKCENGLLEGFKNAVTRLEDRNQIIRNLESKNIDLSKRNLFLSQENKELKGIISELEREKFRNDIPKSFGY